MKDALATKTAPSGRAVSVTVNFWPLQTTSIGVSLRWVWCSDSMLKFTSVTSRGVALETEGSSAGAGGGWLSIFSTTST